MATPTDEINAWITEHGSARDALNVALARLATVTTEAVRECTACEGQGRVPAGFEYASRDMATDAGDAQLEGEPIPQFDTCPVCNGGGVVPVDTPAAQPATPAETDGYPTNDQGRKYWTSAADEARVEVARLRADLAAEREAYKIVEVNLYPLSEALKNLIEVKPKAFELARLALKDYDRRREVAFAIREDDARRNRDDDGGVA